MWLFEWVRRVLGYKKYPSKDWFYHDTGVYRGVRFWIWFKEWRMPKSCIIEYESGLIFEADIPGDGGKCGCKAIKSQAKNYTTVAHQRIDFFLDAPKLSEEIKQSLLW